MLNIRPQASVTILQYVYPFAIGMLQCFIGILACFVAIETIIMVSDFCIEYYTQWVNTCQSSWTHKGKLKDTIGDLKFQNSFFSEPPDFFVYSGRNSL